jgi:hypothetical protein
MMMMTTCRGLLQLLLQASAAVLASDTLFGCVCQSLGRGVLRHGCQA